MRPPPGQAPTQNAITGTRPNAETQRPTRGHAATKRAVASKVIRAMRSAGMPPLGWQVRSLTATLLANHEEPTDEQIVLALMAAPWAPKPRVRRHDVGGPGWRVSA